MLSLKFQTILVLRYYVYFGFYENKHVLVDFNDFLKNPISYTLNVILSIQVRCMGIFMIVFIECQCLMN